MYPVWIQHQQDLRNTTDAQQKSEDTDLRNTNNILPPLPLPPNFLHAHTHTHTYTHTHTCAHTHVSTCMHASKYACMCAHTRSHTHTHTHIHHTNTSQTEKTVWRHPEQSPWCSNLTGFQSTPLNYSLHFGNCHAQKNHCPLRKNRALDYLHLPVSTWSISNSLTNGHNGSLGN